MFSPAQSRAARGLVDWSQTDLSKAAGVSLSTVRDFELSKRTPIANNLNSIQRALEEAGVVFTNGGEPGVKLRPIRSGDWVRLVPNTTLWADPRLKDVRDQAAEVIEPVDDGTSLLRITVRWANGEQMPGLVLGLFQRIPKARPQSQTQE